MRTSQTVEARASEYFSSIKRNIQINVLDALTSKIEALNDRKFELSDFTLKADVNTMMIPLTRQECEARFVQLIDIDFKKELLEVELKAKQKAFDSYFSELPDNSPV